MAIERDQKTKQTRAKNKYFPFFSAPRESSETFFFCPRLVRAHRMALHRELTPIRCLIIAWALEHRQWQRQKAFFALLWHINDHSSDIAGDMLSLRRFLVQFHNYHTGSGWRKEELTGELWELWPWNHWHLTSFRYVCVKWAEFFMVPLASSLPWPH